MAGIWIRGGTVSVTNGSKKVTGVGTTWLTALTKAKKGCLFILDSAMYEVDYVTLDTELYLVEAFAGATASGKSYKIQPFSSDTIPDLSSRLASVLAYMATQYGNLQTWAAGSGSVTLEMPDGTDVTVPALSNLQPKDELLTALAGLTTSSDKLAYFTGADAVSQTALTAFARTLLDDSNSSTALSTLGLSDLAKNVVVASDKTTLAATAGLARANSRYPASTTVEYLKIAELVTNIGANSNDFTAIISGLENFGSSFGASAIIRAGTRNGSNLRVFRLFGGTTSLFGYVNNASTGKTEIWLKRTNFCNRTTVTVLNNAGADLEDIPTVVSIEPSGIVYASNNAFNFGTRPTWDEGTPWDSGNLPYETGTFTPVVAGETTAGIATYSAAVGRYTRIGNRVFIQISLIWTGHNGTGAMRIIGLPFTAQSMGYNSSSLSIGLASNIVFDGTLTARVPAGLSYVKLSSIKTSAAYNDSIAISASGTLFITGSFEI